ncbi:pyruvate phosphate dikinase, PEP/pyruvate binding domain protein [gut metagenome]|uniref:Pyruvate phosphate dikinase, PEP/pyruvate binding domain protein n=1 Tax=gut metagenome TaxID=749906 RepID=J9CQA1_9ZZZZ
MKDAEDQGALRYICSTYDPYDQVLREGYYPGGRKIISYANILQHDLFPLAHTIDHILKIGCREMGRPVEIEFAMDITPAENHQMDQLKATFYLLQIRPIVDCKDNLEEDLTQIPETETVITTHNALGHGIINDVYDLVYVKTDHFDASQNDRIAREIEKLNRKMTEENRGYVLIGPGRWGSSDPWLGIPVKWPHICMARVIVECGLTNYRIDPSQGTHFFQNLTSFGVGYFTINPYAQDGFLDEEWLKQQTTVSETEHIRHIRTQNPIIIKMDGRRSTGVVLKAEHEAEESISGRC